MKYLKTESSQYEKPDDIEKISTFSFWFFILDFPWHRRFSWAAEFYFNFHVHEMFKVKCREDDCMWFLTEKKHQKIILCMKMFHTLPKGSSLKKKKYGTGLSIRIFSVVCSADGSKRAAFKACGTTDI